MVATMAYARIPDDRCVFQSAFHRGNGCYYSAPTAGRQVRTFSPLFVGAMVATYDNTTLKLWLDTFQSPFRRGNGCYNRAITHWRACGILSVPFSSGQWLLPQIIGWTFAHYALSVPFSSGQWLLLYD